MTDLPNLDLSPANAVPLNGGDAHENIVAAFVWLDAPLASPLRAAMSIANSRARTLRPSRRMARS
jgi:hypothetical protein